VSARPGEAGPIAASLVVRAGDAFLLGALALWIETQLFGLARRSELMGPHEIAFAGRTLLPLGVVLLGPLALALGLLHEVLGRAGSRAATWRLRTRMALAGALLLGSAAVIVVSLRASLAPGGALAATVLALALAAAPAALRAGRPGAWGGARAAAALGVVALGVAYAGPAAKRLALMDGVRGVYARAPLSRFAVELGARLVPPPPIREAPSAIDTGQALDLRGRDLLLVTIDSLRADHVGAYGYARKTSPALDALAEDGVLLEAAYAPAPESAHSLGSLFTGKYLRPLLAQGIGQDSDTLARLLRRYGIRTAAWFPKRLLVADGDRLAWLRERSLDFDHAEEKDPSPADVVAWLDASPGPAFVWIHLPEPHPPYVAHEEHPFGPRDVDRYDSEIAAADARLAAIAAAFRKARPRGAIVVTADHGEEFGEHGGRSHGSSVYDEQVHVPLVVSVPGLVPRRIKTPVSLVDLAPTLLGGMAVPRPARLRGRDLSALLLRGDAAVDPRSHAALEAFAFSEAEEALLFARGSDRLVCQRASGACALYDVAADPRETRDLSRERPEVARALRDELRHFEGSHGRYELRGRERATRGLPEAIRRGLAGDGDAALDVAALLSTGPIEARRDAAAILFELRRPETAPLLRQTLLASEDAALKDWCALALARLGEGAPRARDLLAGSGGDPAMRRLAALALAEWGEDRGQDELADWLRAGYPSDRAVGAPLPDPASGLQAQRVREILRALAKVRSKRAVPAILRVLDDPRVGSLAAEVLGQIGDGFARLTLGDRFWWEPQLPARMAIARALLALRGRAEIRGPLVRWLGTPDPLPGGLEVAMKIGILDIVGGPKDGDRRKLAAFARSGIVIPLIIPKVKEPSDQPSPPHLPGARVICRAATNDSRGGEIRVGRAAKPIGFESRGWAVPHTKPELDPRHTTLITVPASREPLDVFTELPAGMPNRPGDAVILVVYATQNVEVSACAVVPLRGELAPRAP